MAVKLKKDRGDRRGRYTGFELLNSGAYALSYKAEAPGGGRVFFKQYKSPSMSVDWYPGFMAHQHEIKRRVEADAAVKDSCYQFIEFFEHKETKFGHEHREFCQVFEFIDSSKTLTHTMESRKEIPWRRLAIFAKVMAMAIHGLHNVGIVHTDLKPENIILIPDAAIGTGFRLRLIDLDWAIFADQNAPWHGRQGYVGTPGYLSPEHVKGQVPTPASDVFTTGIMLAQILAGRHPFAAVAEDNDRYAKAVTTADFEPIKVEQPLDAKSDTALVERMLTAMLNPDPNGRPAMRKVCDALAGKKVEWKVDFTPRRGRPDTSPEPRRADAAPPVEPGRSSPVKLVFNGAVVATASVDAEFGKRTLSHVHADAQYMGSPQFRLRREVDGWVLEHAKEATNDTLVNGKKLEGTVPVTSGMTVCVGNAAKGVAKFPIVLQLGAA